jgi:outer membrane scaffolding protein for murein synthesis (MipA/OmpV family)
MKIAALFLTILTPFTALAANVDIEPIPDLPINTVPAAPATESASASGVWKFSVGGGISYAPRYEGAANDRLRFMPLLEASYSDGHFFASVLRGIGYNFSDSKNTQYGIRIAPGHRRKESADPHLYGMGSIGFTPEAGLFLNRRFGPWYVSSGISSGNHGTHAELGGGIGFPLSVADRLRFGVNLNWGNAEYSQTYFGVTSAQATASGNVLSAYTASAGVVDYALTSNWQHNYSEEWFSSTGLSYKWLGDSAKRSPLTQRSAMASANFLLGYRF